MDLNINWLNNMISLSILGSHMVNKDLSGHPGPAQLNGNQPY